MSGTPLVVRVIGDISGLVTSLTAGSAAVSTFAAKVGGASVATAGLATKAKGTSSTLMGFGKKQTKFPIMLVIGKKH